MGTDSFGHEASWPLVTENGARVFNEENKKIVALDAQTGVVQWFHKNDRNMCSVEWWTVGPGGDVIISSDDCFLHTPDFLYRLDGATGKVQTNFSFRKGHFNTVADGSRVKQVTGHPTVSADGKTVIIQSWPVNGVGGSLIAVDASTGALLWNFGEHQTRGLVEGAGGAIIVSLERELVALDTRSNERRWKHDVMDLSNPAGLTPPALSLDGSVVFVGNCACCFPDQAGSDPWRGGTICPHVGCLGSLEAVDSRNGSALWAKNMSDSCPHQLTSTSGQAVVMLVEGSDPMGPRWQQLRAVGAQTGATLWSRDLPDGAGLAEYLVQSGRNGSAVVLSSGSRVSSIDAQSGKVQWEFSKPGASRALFT